MQDVLSMTYFWLKAGHIIFVIFWMAGLFLLPRLFVYHQEDGLTGEIHEKWLSRERKTLKIVLGPSLIVVWVLGLALTFSGAIALAGWFLVKLVLVFLLTGYHMYLAVYAKKLAAGQTVLTGKQLRLINEIPGIAMALIVILVAVKPF